MKTTLPLILTMLAAAPVLAGECIDWNDEACAVCVRDLATRGKKLGPLKDLKHLQEPPGELKGSDCAKQAGSWYCFPQVCLVGKAIEAIVELDQGKDPTAAGRAADILGALQAYRSCSKENLPALKLMLAHYPKSTPGFKKAAQAVLRNLHTEGKDFGDLARPCGAFLMQKIDQVPGDLRPSLYIGLARVSIWEEEKTLTVLRLIPQIRDYARSRFPLPDCLKTYFDLERQGLLRLLEPGFLRILRNAVLARHGRKFKSADLQEFFQKQPWYKPRDSYSLTKIKRGDRINIKLISKEESRRKKFKSP